jgi:thymidine phosphorylase
MVAIGIHAGVRTEAFITDMDVPLGRAVGNALEIIECLETLKGRGPAELTDLVTRCAGRMVILAGVESDVAAAGRRVNDAITSGRALQVFARMIEYQGGNARVVDDYAALPAAPHRELFHASRSGFIQTIRAEGVGRASNALGAGRSKVGDAIDHSVGLRVLVARGDQVIGGQPLLELHHRDGRGLDAALTLCGEAVDIGDAPPRPRERILGEVR